MSVGADQPGPEIAVSRRARSRPDRAGDPLDGLVNLFDLGIVLAVAFLLAALSSLQLSDLLTSKDVSVVRQNGNAQTVITKKGDKVQTVDISKQKVVGQGTPIGTVYRLSDGRTVVVQGSSSTAGGTPTPEGETPPATGTVPPASGASPNATVPPADGSTPTTPTTPTPPGSSSTPDSGSGLQGIFGQ